jgi:hypothetical protein
MQDFNYNLMKQLIFIGLLMFTVVVSGQRTKYNNITEKDGKIGIGTKTPDELLTVKGKIHTQEVLVDLNGAVAPDYVFETYFKGFSNLNPDYNILSLKEVDEFIKKNHHLPKIPSAEILEKEGMSLKEMNLLLLEKIEELTLYTIEQQKEIEALKNAISSNKN